MSPSPHSGAAASGHSGTGGPPLPIRVVVLSCDGFYQRWLAQQAAASFDLVGVVVQHPPFAQRKGLLARLSRYRDPSALTRQLMARWKLPAYERRGETLRRQLFCPKGTPPEIPAGVPVLQTEAINGPETVAFVKHQAPDLVLVNGTQLLREPLLALRPNIRHGILNLHTGLSPYSRGANCNLYMILEGHPELVGVTIHHIDQGIDSGDIIRSAQVPLEPDDNFETIDVRSFHLGITLLLEAARELVEGSAPRVRQWEQGKLFLKRTGYHYESWQRLAASRLLEAGLLREYLADRVSRDAAVRLVGAGSERNSTNQEDQRR
jgi:methionyl-tRNA formyltransferase